MNRVFHVQGTRFYVVARNINSAVIAAVIMREAVDVTSYFLSDITQLRNDDLVCLWGGRIKFDGCSDAHIGDSASRHLHLCGTDEIEDFCKALMSLHTVAHYLIPGGLLDGLPSCFNIALTEVNDDR